MRVVVLASGTGSLLEALLAQVVDGAPYRIVAVVVDRDCRAEQIAADAGVAVISCAPKQYSDRAAWDTALTEQVGAHQPDWVVTAGFMRILGPDFLGRFPSRIINSHPSLLPAFPGAHAVADALAHGVKVTGTTVHLVDSGVDTGPILAQTAVPIETGDTEDTLHERIKEIERTLLPEVVAAVVSNGVVADGRKAYIP